jgi:hypothetical protein
MSDERSEALEMDFPFDTAIARAEKAEAEVAKLLALCGEALDLLDKSCCTSDWQLLARLKAAAAGKETT